MTTVSSRLVTESFPSVTGKAETANPVTGICIAKSDMYLKKTFILILEEFQ